MVDAVLSVHTNVMACGTAKFSKQLAERLGVPFAACSDRYRFEHPLYSVRYGELQGAGISRLGWEGTYDVLWHDRFDGQGPHNAQAEHVWYADELGAPSTLLAAPRRQGDI